MTYLAKTIKLKEAWDNLGIINGDNADAAADINQYAKDLITRIKLDIPCDDDNKQLKDEANQSIKLLDEILLTYNHSSRVGR